MIRGNTEWTTLAAGIILFKNDIVKNESGEDIIEPNFLLLKCSKNFHWSPPKGISENDEENDLLRTAFSSQEIHYEAWNKKKTVFYYLGECSSNSKVEISHEHSEYRWANINQVKQLVEFESLIRVFNDAFERIMKEKL
ncbi:diadenosine tetraphosphatase [Cryptosporidium ubiquitum]|uniref:Diadenosine tetraphosphatase n=1 Tax=Cryptosporidium ubiquitum TaxID=857276 RepID=A0A1J4M9G1_9CRYT|nr:diadenosine tetraphosphatase [Cryptosporidium ubiquitum]OII70857.1 diadenosine tetraphosphatase [Cryptosporidium ubiquitum]